MRNLIFEILTAAVMAAGLPADPGGEDVVYEGPVKIKDALLPSPRVEIQIMDQAVKPSGRKLAKFSRSENRTIRTAKDMVIQPVRLSIIAKDQNWLEEFAHSLHRDLPRKIADRYNNVVSVQVETVKSSGGGSKLVKVGLKTKLEKIFHIRFTGFVTTDSKTPWLEDTEINVDYKKEVNYGQENDG